MDAKVFPTVSTKDLVIHPREHDLIIGTFGRAAWVLDDIRPLRALAKANGTSSGDAQLFSPPPAYLAAYQQPTGSRFGADAMYHGENRKYGAMFTYFYKAVSEKASQTKDSLSLKIYDGDRLIRTLKRKAPKETGLHRWYWNMDEKGVERPRRKARAMKREPSGVGVLPGEYLAVLETPTHQNTVSIEVRVDPRIEHDLDGMKAQYAALKSLENMTAISAKAVKQLTASKETLSDYQKRLAKKDKEAHKELIDQCKSTSKEITALVDLFLGKEDKRQGIVRNPKSTVMTRIGLARRYIASRPSGLNSTENVLMDHATTDVNAALKQVNDFYAETWPALKTKIEAVDLSGFAPTKVFTLED